MKISITTVTALSLSALGSGLMIYYAVNKSFNDGSGIINTSIASDYGSFISGVVGPIFSLAGIFLIYETLNEQRKAFQIQQFEAKFFELIKYHRENVSSMSLRVPSHKDKTYYTGSRCFIEIKYQFEQIFEIVLSYLEKSKIIPKEKLEEESIKISYILIFYGVGANSLQTIQNILKNYDGTVIKSIINKCREKKAAYNVKTVYFGGSQARLGHYFRHLFFTVSFVDKVNFLTTEEKYEYIKLLRAQLTQYELAIFFYNSLSVLGLEWENKKWVTNYQLIKNIPQKFMNEIEPKKYYPKVTYEWEQSQKQ